MTVESFAGGTLEFDRVVIDLTGRRLLVDGATVALEPKAFAVLWLLAQQPGHAFTRPQILDAVWGHRHVTAGALNRSMTLVRQAIGDDGKDRLYLRTLYGVGYRFDAPVRHVPAPERRTMPPARNSGDLALPAPHALAQQLDAGAGAELAANPATPPPHAVPASAAASRAHRSFTSWRRPAILLVTLAVLLAWLVSQRHTNAPAGPAGTGQTLVVLPLHAVGDDRDEANFAAGLSEELVTRLAHIDGLRLISATSAAQALQHGRL